jgi:nitric oxide reductase NorD protein
VDGEELVLDALVSSHVDRVAGLPFDDRFYRTTRPLRRDLAISLLVDVSGSTDAWVGEDLRVVDVEKEALLLCCHALDALGDPYAIEAFSGEGPHGVEMWQVKGFVEMDRVAVVRRIADLEPDDYTRAGAALRHATAGLAARHEQHRLLLLLSDGKPNDEDHYGGVYGVEDMRQAVHEAIAAGISVFCLTVDREAPTYLPRIFGPWRSTTLAHANELPVALVEALRHLIRR